MKINFRIRILFFLNILINFFEIKLINKDMHILYFILFKCITIIGKGPAGWFVVLILREFFASNIKNNYC